MLKDKPLRLKRRLITIAICLVLLGAMWGLTAFPGALERAYAQLFGFYAARLLSAITSVLPVSLAEWCLAGLVVLALALISVSVWQLVRRERTAGNILTSGALRAVTMGVVLVTLFYVLWGLNYARATLPERLGWAPIERPENTAESQRQTDEIATFTQQLIEATNASYRAFAGTDDLGHPSERPAGAASLDDVLDAAYARVGPALGLEPGFAVARGRAKPLAASLILNHLQLSGFYFPWTGEANFNRLVPSPTLPHTMAHEKAHQRGIAREDEANFLGYLACAMSDEPYTRYAGFLFAEQQLLGELVRRDLPRAREVAAPRAKGVLRDIEAVRLFWEQYEGAAARMSERVNNSYLKSQGEKRGIAAYAASKNLIVLFARRNGGDARPK